MQEFKVASAKARLQVVATPLGNLQEVTLRAMSAFEQAELVVCEDTRVTGKLFQVLGIGSKRLVSLVSLGEVKAAAAAVATLQEGYSVLLVSDAGYPGVSDPGAQVVSAVYDAGFVVEVINGPSAIMHALAVSGFAFEGFYFQGFLPARAIERKKRLNELAQLSSACVIFEAPHRIHACLTDMAEIYGESPIVVCRELTKLHETIYRGAAKEILAKVPSLGEFVIVVGQRSQKQCVHDLKRVVAQALSLMEDGMRQRPACARAAANTSFSGSQIYEAIEEQKGKKKVLPAD